MTTTTDAPEWVSEHGDGWAPNYEVLRTLAGSNVHGLSVGTDDRDEMGVYVPPLRHLVGLRAVKGSYVARTQADGARSWQGDTDLVLYDLQRYVRLVVAGNPTTLTPLYAAEEHVLHATSTGWALRAGVKYLVSQQAGHRFLGYLHAQRERMLGGGKRNRVPNRPELVERYGYDTKYAGHALRLAMQGLELLAEGRLTLPLREPQRSTIIQVRQGRYEMAEVLSMVDEAERQLTMLLESGKSPLPVRPDVEAVDGLLEVWTRMAWMEQKQQQWRAVRATIGAG